MKLFFKKIENEFKNNKTFNWNKFYDYKTKVRESIMNKPNLFNEIIKNNKFCENINAHIDRTKNNDKKF